MEEFKSNSHKSKEVRKDSKIPEKKIEKVVSGGVKTKKKSDILKFADVFIAEDMENVKTYIVSDVIIPTVKNTIADIVTNGLNMILFGETNRNSKRSTSSKISYNSYYDRKSNDRPRSHQQTRGGYFYDDVILDSRGDAEEVLTCLDELIETYGTASVADLGELIGVTGEYTDNKYGWNDLRNASVERTRDGYRLKLPRAVPLH